MIEYYVCQNQIRAEFYLLALDRFVQPANALNVMVTRSVTVTQKKMKSIVK